MASRPEIDEPDLRALAEGRLDCSPQRRDEIASAVLSDDSLFERFAEIQQEVGPVELPESQIDAGIAKLRKIFDEHNDARPIERAGTPIWARATFVKRLAAAASILVAVLAGAAYQSRAQGRQLVAQGRQLVAERDRARAETAEARDEATDWRTVREVLADLIAEAAWDRKANGDAGQPFDDVLSKLLLLGNTRADEARGQAFFCAMRDDSEGTSRWLKTASELLEAENASERRAAVESLNECARVLRLLRSSSADTVGEFEGEARRLSER
jgi:hypothetical protein